MSCPEKETLLAITKSAMALVPEIDFCPIFSAVGVDCPNAGQGVHVLAQDIAVSVAKEETHELP